MKGTYLPKKIMKGTGSYIFFFFFLLDEVERRVGSNF